MTEPEQTSREWVWRVRGVSAYFGLQGVAVLLWWLSLSLWPSLRGYFHTSQISGSALMDFAWPDVPLLGLGSLVCAIAVHRAARSVWTQRLVWLLVGAAAYPTLYVFGATLTTQGEGWLATMAMLAAAQGTFLAAWSIRSDGPLFRVAPRRPTHVHIARTLVQTAFFWALALWLTPWLMLQAEMALGIPRFRTPFQSWLPWVLFVAPGIANVFMGYTMSRWGEGTPLPLETARSFVVRGGYRVVRNPMAVSGLTLGLLIGWWLGSWLTLAAVVAGGLFWHLFVKPIEEQDLLRRFGPPYAAYQERVGCWLPCWPPHPPAIYPALDAEEAADANAAQIEGTPVQDLDRSPVGQ